MFTLVPVFTVAGLFLIAQPGNSQPQAAVERYRAGYELLTAGKFAAAAIEFEQATRLDSTYANAHFLLGQAYKKSKAYRKAIAAFEAAERCGFPRQRIVKWLAPSHFEYARDSYDQLKYTQAIRSFESALALDPGNTEARYYLGLCYVKLSDSGKAREAFEAAASADPSDARPHKALGDLDLQVGAHEGARAAYQRSVSLDSAYTGAYAGLAQIHIEHGEEAEAVLLLRRATRIDPRFGEGFLLLGFLLTRLENPQEAVAALAQAVKLRPKNAEFHYRLGEAYLATGELEKAISSGNAALSLDADYHPAEVLLGDTYARLGHHEKARSWYSKAVNDSRFKDYCAFKLNELAKGTP